MKRTTLLKASVAAAAMITASGAAMAADAPIYDKGPVAAPIAAAPAPLWSWTGFYAGLNAGYGWGGVKTDEGDIFDSGTRFDIDADGAIVGGQIGYNWQMDSFVFGVETDLQWADLSTSRSGDVFFDDDDIADGTYRFGAEMNWFGTTRIRAGYAMDRFLVYATGGIAYGDADVGFTYDGDVEDVRFGRDDKTRIGYAVGGGVEGAITDNLTAKVEYLYVDLGSQDYDLRFPDGDEFTTISNETDFDAHIVRAGLNYKF
ncbi:outer membrane protein [Lutibaculum baratangense]|uniref:Outer membrane protein Omp31 n=1 Tax=Lutibaculum baratangense AMV1 TaxID=631454 RepID=V4TMC4_9HYPH|nr:outer membrane protein [Lutibaculum baratangense]ESR26888.1 outer membrane protein Omp31 [Lutibaculum baratangense AMV1]